MLFCQRVMDIGDGSLLWNRIDLTSGFVFFKWKPKGNHCTLFNPLLMYIFDGTNEGWEGGQDFIVNCSKRGEANDWEENIQNQFFAFCEHHSHSLYRWDFIGGIRQVVLKGFEST